MTGVEIAGLVIGAAGLIVTIITGAPSLMGKVTKPVIGPITIDLEPSAAATDMHVGDSARLNVKFDVTPGDCDDGTEVRLAVTIGANEVTESWAISEFTRFDVPFTIEGHRVGLERIVARVWVRGEECSGFFLNPDDAVRVTANAARQIPVNPPYVLTKHVERHVIYHGEEVFSELKLTARTVAAGRGYVWHAGDYTPDVPLPRARTISDVKGPDTISVRFSPHSQGGGQHPTYFYLSPFVVNVEIPKASFSLSTAARYAEQLREGDETIRCLGGMKVAMRDGTLGEVVPVTAEPAQLAAAVEAPPPSREIACLVTLHTSLGDAIRGGFVSVTCADGLTLEARATEQGLAMLKGVITGSAVTLRYGAKAYQTSEEVVGASFVAGPELSLSLAPMIPNPIRGMVVDDQGAPIPESRVELVRGDYTYLVDLAGDDGSFCVTGDAVAILRSSGRITLRITPRRRFTGDAFAVASVERVITPDSAQTDLLITVQRRSAEPVEPRATLMFRLRSRSGPGAKAEPVAGLAFEARSSSGVVVSAAESGADGSVKLELPAGEMLWVASPAAAGRGIEFRPQPVRLVETLDLGVRTVTLPGTV